MYSGLDLMLSFIFTWVILFIPLGLMRLFAGSNWARLDQFGYLWCLSRYESRSKTHYVLRCQVSSAENLLPTNAN